MAFGKFKKRVYTPAGFFRDFWWLVTNSRHFGKYNALLPETFRERLMLAVTAVNGCRYCSYFHAKQAVKSGLSPEEINTLLSGDVDNCPEDEAVAVIYAQHWAESNTHPDPEALAKLQQTYGEEKVQAIHATLRMIRFGNLMGNSWDYFLYLISFGRYTGESKNKR